MRSFMFGFLAVLFIAGSSPAFALSVDRDSGVNSDGSAKFSDPDEDSPAFLHGGEGSGASVNINGETSHNESPGLLGVEGSHPSMFQNQGPDAFDQSYRRK